MLTLIIQITIVEKAVSQVLTENKCRRFVYKDNHKPKNGKTSSKGKG